MFSARAADERRLRLLRWLSQQGESGVYEMWKGTKLRVYRIYPLLTKLENQGIVSREWTEGEKPRVMYKLTHRGEQVLRDYTSP